MAGSVEGYLVILNAENGSVVSSVRVCGSALTCMGFNPGIIYNNEQNKICQEFVAIQIQILLILMF